MMKSPSKVEGAMTLNELYDAGWKIVAVLMIPLDQDLVNHLIT